MSKTTRLCREEELILAFRLIVTEQQAALRAREFFQLHEVDDDGYLLVDPMEWYPPYDPTERDSLAASTGPADAADSSIAWVPMPDPATGADDTRQIAFGDGTGASDVSIGWALDLKGLSDQRRGSFLMIYGPFTLDLLSLVSASLAERVQAISRLSVHDAAIRRHNMRRALAVLHR